MHPVHFLEFSWYGNYILFYGNKNKCFGVNLINRYLVIGTFFSYQIYKWYLSTISAGECNCEIDIEADEKPHLIMIEIS